jgi:signal transduction histidine kinase
VQIVTRNLLSNAIKYTEAGGTVKVRTYPDDGAAVLEVADSGVGMDPEATEHIFEPFWQGVDGRASGTEGTGLGLALVSRAIRTMDGRIDVATEPGQGTTFTVRLPRADRTAPSRDER